MDFIDGLILGCLTGVVGTGALAVHVIMAMHRSSMATMGEHNKWLRERDDRERRERDAGEWWKAGGTCEGD